ncbi:MAG: hypothetical protein M3N82_08000, partial [Pseudomonadota bacterium]|nr:hypothetical protein [Pseudomonadota bacterium]
MDIAPRKESNAVEPRDADIQIVEQVKGCTWSSSLARVRASARKRVAQALERGREARDLEVLRIVMRAGDAVVERGMERR